MIVPKFVQTLYQAKKNVNSVNAADITVVTKRAWGLEKINFNRNERTDHIAGKSSGKITARQALCFSVLLHASILLDMNYKSYCFFFLRVTLTSTIKLIT